MGKGRLIFKKKDKDLGEGEEERYGGWGRESRLNPE